MVQVQEYRTTNMCSLIREERHSNPNKTNHSRQLSRLVCNRRARPLPGRCR